ncbi:hypothetical protein ACH47B_06495 [Rhodococcus sp. NPDC019627]|uniref:phage holin n=1 Tax=unclassified Rhodococcus (in: high G+C Gram-positive bacteria) TaxID=192944 RepID=UPI0037A05FEE
MAVLDTLRGLVPASARDKVYTVTGGLVVLLAGVGLIADDVASLWAAVVGASVVLFFAVLHSTSPARSALYAFLATAAPLGLAYSIGTASQWAAVLTYAGLVLGVTKAAGSTPAPELGGRHRRPDVAP